MLRFIFQIPKIPKKTVQKMRNWALQWIDTPYLVVALFFIAFAESSFFPVPPDILLIAILAASARKWWYFALVTTVGSVLGGFFGYVIGWSFFELIGVKIVALYHLEDVVSSIALKYSNNAFFTVFLAAFTPIPYKVITISAGLFKISFLSFFAASLFGRGLRFFGVALFFRLFGKHFGHIIEKYFNTLFWIFALILIVGFAAIKFFL
jgi:membrane protein YqaA with SNARE-associated domain